MWRGADMYLSVLVLALVASATADYDWDDWTELDEYVNNDDGAYNYTYLTTYNYRDVTLHLYNMTSQYYLTEEHTDHHLWWHVVGCAFPDNREYDDAGFVFLMGGSNRNDDIPPPLDLWNVGTVKLANDTGMMGCYIAQVINGPIVFYNDPELRRLSGDPQIAYTWRSFIDDPDWSGPTILTRFSMTKAAFRGVDTLINVARDHDLTISKVCAAGASKWGWTTWSLAAVDQRITAIVPFVFSLFNIQETMMRHYQALGGAYSFAMEPYYNEGLTRDLTSESAEDLMQYEDMLFYRRRFAGLRKLMISATGDEYFFPQDFHQFWDEWPEPKWLMMVPNAEHLLVPHYRDVIRNMEAFFIAAVEDIELPRIDWTRDDHHGRDEGEIVMTMSQPPLSYRTMRAVTLQNDTIRDFRLVAGYPDPWIHPVWWRNSSIELVEEDGTELRSVEEYVEDEWVGHFIEATFQGPRDYEFIFTTEVNIIPDTFPVEPCETPDECYGYLV